MDTRALMTQVLDREPRGRMPSVGRSPCLPGDVSFTLGARPSAPGPHEVCGHSQHHVTAAREPAEGALSLPHPRSLRALKMRT